ncbi:MAG: four helix bundle protein [Bacteroidales bacterium]|nr:four helix bundle protein [Bacteroidales bacterium]
MKVEKFEDAEVWQLARTLTSNIYKETNQGQISQDYSLRDQIRRSAVSVMANIAEGFERKSNKEFSHFLFIAKGSAGELRSHLYVALDAGYIGNKAFNQFVEELLIISKSLSGFIKYLRNH